MELLEEEKQGAVGVVPAGRSRGRPSGLPTTLAPLSTEKYAQHWCSRLTDPHGPFARCHAAVNPGTYYSVMPAPWPLPSGHALPSVWGEGLHKGPMWSRGLEFIWASIPVTRHGANNP